MKVLGVDFSGARTDRHTWLTSGVLEDDRLILNDCRSVTRADLADMLSAEPGPAVAALDFPFSVPVDFATRWSSEAVTMSDLWAVAERMELGEFVSLRDEFVALHGEPKRVGDLFYPESYSCLHKANPNLVPMTFRGMQMLARLWVCGCSVPPLIRPDEKPVVLLEAMPGAALRAFGLPFKGYKNGVKAQELRRRILDGLSDRSTVSLRNLGDFREMCLNYHDCLDSVVAAVVAALWVRDPDLFRCAPIAGATDFNPEVLLEGWLYAPALLHAAD